MLGKTKSGQEAKTQAIQEKEARQLIRLERLMDVVFGLLIWRIFTLLPDPPERELVEGQHLLDILARYTDNYIVIIIGFVLIVIYWGQNNMQFGNLARTDGRHAAMSLTHIFFLLLYMYFVKLGEEYQGDIDVLALQSISLAIAGFISVAAWRYAAKNKRLLSDSMSEKEAKERTVSFLSEPLAALVTLPFAFIGNAAWSLAWLSAIPIGWLLKKRLPKEETSA